MRLRRALGDERGFSGPELLVVLGLAGMMALLATAAGYGVNRNVVAEKRVGGMTLDEVLATPTPQPPPAPEPEVQERVVTRERTVAPPAAPPQDEVIILSPPDTGSSVEPGESHTSSESSSSGGGGHHP